MAVSSPRLLRSTLLEISGHSLIYSVGSLAGSLASILLLPIYTRYLSKADYGILEILDHSNTILMLLLVAGLNSAIPRFFSEAENEEARRKVIATATAFVLVAASLVCCLAVFLADPLALVVLGKGDGGRYVAVNSLLLFVQVVGNVSGLAFIARKESKVYLMYMLLRLSLSAGANIYLIVFLKWGVWGMLYGNLLGNGLVAAGMVCHNVVANGLRVSFPTLKGLLRFGLPLIPAMILATFMHNADRFLIRFYCSLDDVGIYGLGYKFPFMLNVLILQSFSYIWTGATMYEVSRQPDAPHQYGRITTYVVGFFLFAQLALGLFSVPILRLLADPKFFPAHRVIPLVAMGLCFHAFYFFFSMGSFLRERTWLLNVAYLPAAALNIAGNIILLPRYGFMAAAWVTIATYLVFAVILYFACNRLVTVTYEFRRLGILFGSGTVAFIISSSFIFDSIVLEITKGALLLVCFAVSLLLTGWFTNGEMDFIKEKYGGLVKVS